MYKRYILFLVLMIVLSPLGLIAEGTAWGEWGGDEMEAALGYIPHGLTTMEGAWKALFPDYSLELLGQSTAAGITGYILSAIVGSVVIYFLTTLLLKPMAHAPAHSLQKDKNA